MSNDQIQAAMSKVKKGFQVCQIRPDITGIPHILPIPDCVASTKILAELAISEVLKDKNVVLTIIETYERC